MTYLQRQYAEDRRIWSIGVSLIVPTAKPIPKRRKSGYRMKTPGTDEDTDPQD